MKKLQLRSRVEADRSTGEILAVYFQVRKGHAARVIELADGNAFANYDRNGLLLGIELLAPCNIAVFDQVTRMEPKEVKEFLRDKIPLEMAKGA